MSSQLINKPLLGTPLNRSHPLAQGLVGSFPLNEMGGSAFYNNVNGRQSNFSASPNMPTWGSLNSVTGINLGFSYTHLHALISEDAIIQLPMTKNFSIVFKCCTNDAVSTSSHGVLGWEGTDDISFHINYGSAGSSGVRIYWRDCGGVLTAYDTFDMKYLPSFVAFTAMAGSQKIYRDGRLYSSFTNNLSAVGDFSTFVIGDTSDYSQPFGGILECVNFYNKVLCPDEIMSLYLDSYATFRPSMPYWFWSSGIAEITGTVEGSLDRLTGSLTIKHGVAGTVTGETDRLSGAIAAVHGVTGTMSGSLQRISESIDGSSGYSGTITGSLLRLGGALSGGAYELVSGTIEGSLDELTGQFTGTVSIQAVINGELDRLEGNLSGRIGGGGRNSLYIELDIGI